MPDIDIQNGYLKLALIVALFAVLAYFAIAFFAWLRRRKTKVKHQVNELAIDVTSLELDEIVSSEQLLLYGIPMRLVALILAPSGHAVKFPSDEDLPENIERLVPGLPGLLNSHQPIFRQWPTQVSIEGFKRSFFQNIPLPGENGKGTRWCGVVGSFESKQGRLLAGLILLAEEPNGYGKIELEHEGHWHQTIQIKSS